VQLILGISGKKSKYLHLHEGTLYRVIGLPYLEDPECYSYTGSSVALGRVFLAGQDDVERLDEERYPCPLVGG
jgi:hypothetical protein